MEELSQRQMDDFRREGYLLLRQVLPDDLLVTMRSMLEDAVDEIANRWVEDGLLEDLHQDEPFERRLAVLRERVPSAGSITWRRLLAGEAAFSLWQHPTLLAIAASLVGEDVYAHGVWNGRPREPNAPLAAVAWHQDAHYYDHYDRADGPLVTLWMPLVPVDEHSGCLQIAPRSHQEGVRPVTASANGLVEVTDPPAESEILTCAMDPGDLLIFDAEMLHRSLPNEADYVRWSMDLRYGAATPAIMAKGGRGYVCASTSRLALGGYEDWIQQYERPELEEMAAAASQSTQAFAADLGWADAELDAF